MQKITPHLWFDKEAREAAELYVSLFPSSRIKSVTTLSDTPSGDCDVVSFELAGQPFMSISAGPLFKFNPSVSFNIKCDTKKEVDTIWERLSPSGKILMPIGSYPFSEYYGWLEDKYGLSWQVMYRGASAGSQKLTPVLMFVGNVCGKAEDALNFYASVFKSAPGSGPEGPTKADILSRYGAGDKPDKEGTVRYAHLSLLGQEFAAMDSARDHRFAFNEAISFMVPCDTQEEIDHFWSALSVDPTDEQCGWLKDKYGLSWQITSTALRQLLNDPDRQKSQRVLEAMLQMKKIVIADLQRAYEGRAAA